MNTNIQDGDRHLRPVAYYALALLAGAIGLSASYVTAKLFALAIQATEQEGTARELLTLTAALFVIAELAAFFIAGLVPVRRLRALRWQLTACAIALLAFEAVSIYGARVTLVQSADARADAGAGRVEQLKASIEANRRSAAALVEAGQRSSQSAIASSRADGARSIRDAAALEAATARLAAELAQLEAARAPTVTAVFGESGVIAWAVAQSLLISGIGLLFLGAAGALARAARDAGGAATPAAVAAPAQPPRIATPQTQAVPNGATATVPNWHRYALPASAIAASAGLVAMAPSQASAAQVEAATPAASASIHTGASTSLQPDAAATPAAAAVDTPAKKKASRAATPRAASVRDTGVGEGDGARFLRVREGIEAGRIKPSVRAIYAAEGASQAVAKRYLLALERAGIIELAGRGKGYRLCTA